MGFTVADIIGVDPDRIAGIVGANQGRSRKPKPSRVNGYRLTKHIREQIKEKGFDEKVVLAVVAEPTVVAPARIGTQRRFSRNGIVVIVDDEQRTLVTTYADQVETPLRPDQVDERAQAYGHRAHAA